MNSLEVAVNSESSPGTVGCPVCNNAVPLKRALYCYTAAQAAEHFCPITRNTDRYERLLACIAELWQGNGCSILHCEECGVSFGYPFVGGSQEFYDIFHEQKGYPKWRSEYDVAVKTALKPTAGGKIIDVGAGVGMFLRGLGPEWQRHAVEYSQSNIRELEGAGIRVFQNLSDAQSESGTFQAVTLFQVLEHMADFSIVLKQCRRLLSAGGRIFISVPDGDAMILQEKLAGLPDMPPNHIVKWTPKSLSLALRQAGFKPEQAGYEPSSWRNVPGFLYKRIVQDAKDPHSLAAKIYRIRNKRLRAPLLALLAAPALLKLLPNLQQMRRAGSFSMIGIAD